MEQPQLNHPSRSLIPAGETVAYTGHFHFLNGAKWLALFVLCGALSVLFFSGTLFVAPASPYNPAPLQPSLLLRALSVTAALIGLGVLIWYLLPFWRSFLIITNERALVGVGHFTMVQEQILPYQLEDWEIRQNFFESLLGYGHITLRLIEGRQLRIIAIPYVAEPHVFIRHLEELSPPDTRHSARALAAVAAAATGSAETSSNAETAPPPQPVTDNPPQPAAPRRPGRKKPPPPLLPGQ